MYLIMKLLLIKPLHVTIPRFWILITLKLVAEDQASEEEEKKNGQKEERERGGGVWKKIKNKK